MTFFSELPAAPTIRPSLPVGSVFDIPTGQFFKGKDGENILNGGIAGVNSLQGPGNSFKSEILNYLLYSPLARYNTSMLAHYDTENTMTYERIERVTGRYSSLDKYDFRDPANGKLRFTQSADMLGDVYFQMIKEASFSRSKNGSRLLTDTPFYDKDNKKFIQILPPIIVGIDSLSEMKISDIEKKIVKKNAVGDSKTKIAWMHEGGAKTQLISQLPNLTATHGIFFVMSAHTGSSPEMGKFDAKPNKLTHSKNGITPKGVPQRWDVINNNLFEIFSAKPIYNETDTGPDRRMRYPGSEESDNLPSMDLNEVTLVTIRNKGGASGFKYKLIISQRYGFLPDLTMWHYIKESNYGYTGSTSNYVLDLLPDIKLSRTKVRAITETNKEFVKALEFTTQLCQINALWKKKDKEYYVTPAELYKGIIDKGYDWKILLNTRNYWVFNKDEKDELPYLSIMDLLEMNAGIYKPKWYKGAK